MDAKLVIRKIIDTWPLTKKWGYRQGIYTLAGSLLVLILLLIFIFSSEESISSTGYGLVRRGEFFVDLVEYGDVEAISKHGISAPMMWGEKLQVTDLVDEGVQVTKGDTLIRFDVTDLTTQLDLARDRLTTLKADLEKLQAQQKLVIENLENQQKLTEYSHQQAGLRLEMKQFESEASKKESELELKQAELDLKTVKKQLTSQKVINYGEKLKSELTIKQAEYKVASLQRQIDRLILTAPENGMVVYQNLSDSRLKMGYEANPGRALMSIPDLSRMMVKCYINEVDRQRVYPGQKARIVLEAYPDTTFTGTVKDVSMLAQDIDYEDGLKGFVLDIDIHGADRRLKPGVSARISILEDTLRDVLYVPNGTIFEKDGRTCVFEQGSSNPIPVNLGPRNDGFFVVRGDTREGLKLSWAAPEGWSLLGKSDEQARIEKIRETLLNSFDVFHQRGILHDYLEGGRSSGGQDEAKKDILDKLPASLRERLQQDKTIEKSNTPTVKTGQPGSISQKGEFKVSPEMLKRLEKEPEQSSAQKR